MAVAFGIALHKPLRKSLSPERRQHSQVLFRFPLSKNLQWLERVGVKTLFIEPGSPWENGYVESFNCNLRDELLDREVFDSLLEAKVLIGR